MSERPTVSRRFSTSRPIEQSAIDRTAPVRPPAEESDEGSYFANNSPPEYLDELAGRVQAFLDKHSASGRRIAIVTSGGTTVPLENNTVRFIDNFSAGTRGSLSSEHFLEQGYAVMFVHREFSLLPYSRHYSHTTNCFLDYMTETADGEVTVSHEYQETMVEVLRKYQRAKREDLLLLVPFTTINQYLFTLRMISLKVGQLTRPNQHLFYLAAAVSDFFLPKSRMSEHKIQSQGGGSKLMVDLDPVPKFLKRLVDTWSPGAMIVSFKLETDSSLLLSKARTALQRYSHQLVIGNLLQTRKKRVTFVTPSDVTDYELTDDEVSQGLDIEAAIVPAVIKLHDGWIKK